RQLKIERDLAAGLRAADQRAARRGWLERVRPVADLAADQPGLAGVADAGPAAEPDGDVAGLGQLQEAGEGRVPRDRQVTAAERDHRAPARLASRRMRSALGCVDDTGC